MTNNTPDYKNDLVFAPNETEEENFEHYICTHVFNRIKMYLYDTQGDEDYMLDMPPNVFEKILKILNQYKKGTYKPSKTYR